MKKSFIVALVALSATIAVAARSSHYDMGPVHRFTPEVGDEVNTISFASGYVIDTRTGEPSLPSELRQDDVAGQPSYQIVQFNGPLRQDWLRRLSRLGVRSFGYLPNYAVVARLDDAQRAQVAALPMVHWVGRFQPAYKLEPGLLETPGLARVTALLMPGEAADGVVRLVAERGGSVEAVQTSNFGTTIAMAIDRAGIPALAGLQEVAWVQHTGEATVCNSDAQWVTQTGWRNTAPAPDDTLSRRAWARGVRGQRLILSTTDTGLNTGHDLFRDPAMSITPPGIWPDHRKVAAFKLYQGASENESPYHGSHVNGTVAGDDAATGGTSYYDGMSIDARLYFVDVSSSGGGFMISTDLTPLWDSVYLGRGLPDSVRPITQTSGSWGWSNSSGTYLLQDASTDAYCWAHKDFLNILAAGNEYSARTLRNPGISKNTLTVGATANGTSSNAIANFSSRGPTQDNRIKPNICAPGVSLYSASPAPSTNGYSAMSGTSMATPAVNGATGLIRCYLREGYYPTGAAVPGNKVDYISSALMRSMVMASADPNIGSFEVPSFDMGWGRIDVDSVLYFTGDTRKLIIRDDTTGIGTGEYTQLQFNVNSAIPLRVCLAWTDTAAAPNANPTLVNDLNLELTAPGGTYYRGNQYTSGQSTADPTAWDTVNVEECARVNAPASGVWTLRVRGNQVRTAREQGYGLTITGDVSLDNINVGVQRIVAPAVTVDSGTTVTPRAWVRNYGSIAATFPVSMKIGSSYSDSRTVTGLAPGDSVTVTFTTWTALPRGVLAVRCSTGLTNDQYPGNDTLSGTVTVRVTNVGVTTIVAPSGNVDSGTTVTPQARVKNFGTATLTSLPVTFRISPSYSDTRTVTSLAPNDSALVSFNQWTANQNGTFATKCTVALTGDQVPGNNYQTGTVTVRMLNVGVTSITAPTGTYDSGAAVQPRARVKNYGSGAATFPVTFRIGAGYTSTQTVTSLAAGDSVLVGFASWTASPRGTFATRCSTGMTGDRYPADDTISGSVTVRVLNVGVTQIIAPTGTFDSGATVTPRARVRNYGSGAATFPVTFRVGSFYSNTQTVTGLAPNDSALVSFAAWSVLQRGTHTTRCTTALTGDAVPSNNALSGTVTVRVTGDVGVSQILAPSGIIDSGAVVQPQAVVWNYGSMATFPVTFRIGTIYSNTQTVTNLAPEESVFVTFANWSAVKRGTYTTTCSTALVGDTIPSNNGAAGTVTVRVQDIGVSNIASPAGAYEPGWVIIPAATVRNYGSVPADFDVSMLIFDPTGAPYYSAGTSVTGLAPGAYLLVNSFPACTLSLLGDWTVKCSTAMPGDVHLANNVLSQGFRTRSIWSEMLPMPLTTSGQPAKDGAWLAYDNAGGLVYAAKGNRTSDFYSYNPGTGNWTPRHAVPAGIEAKLPRKGTTGTADGSGCLYMAKGYNTLGFWRYDIARDSWNQLAGVPAGEGSVKNGASATYVPAGAAGYVYLLKGGGPEFCRYNTAGGDWTTLQPAPTGSSRKWDKGSFIIYDQDHTIYAHKAKYNELWAYNIQTDSWSHTALSGMPFVSHTGRNKKSKDGGSGAWVNGYIYALKGGNTCEFWCYNAAADEWTELDTMPSRGSSGRQRKVNAGGAITNAAGTLFAMKGNKTRELWRYRPGPGFAAAPMPDRTGVMASSFIVPRSSFIVTPNPLASGFVTIDFSSPLRTPATLTIHNAAGRLVHSSFGIRTSPFRVDLRSMPAGVYLVKLASAGHESSQKLIVQR